MDINLFKINRYILIYRNIMGENADVESDDYYKVLGIDRKATEEDIKKNYRKLSLKYHPDRNQDNKSECERIFKRVGEAYQILTDKQKRTIYDQVGKNGLQGHNNGGQGVNPFEMFSSMFGGGDMFGGGIPGFSFSGMGGGNRAQPKRKEQHLEKINLTLEQIYTGYKEVKHVTLMSTCRVCDGFGSADVQQCVKCNGMGIINQVQQIAPGFITQTRGPCGICGGQGKIAKSDKKCNTCMGRKKTEHQHNLNVEFPPGIDKGEALQMDLDEHQFIFTVNLESHPLFQRDSCNIIYEKDITLCDALCGVEIPIKLLNGQTILVKTPDDMVIHPNTIHVIPGAGLPVRGQTKFGDLKIVFNIVFPNRISNDRKQYLYKILTKSGVPRKPIEPIGMKVIMLDTTKILDNKPNNRKQEKNEDDDNDTELPQPNIQCAQQ
jgi:DnaJ-class molecular chaperone